MNRFIHRATRPFFWTACGLPIAEKWDRSIDPKYFAMYPGSEEKAMQTSPGMHGWLTEDLKLVDCPACRQTSGRPRYADGPGWPFSTPAPGLTKLVEADVAKVERYAAIDAQLNAEFRAFAAKHPELSLDEAAKSFAMDPPYTEPAAPAEVWLLSTHGEDFSDSDEYTSRDEAIEAGKSLSNPLDLGHNEPFYVGRKIAPFDETLELAGAVLNELTDAAYARVGEHASEWDGEVNAKAFASDKQPLNELNEQLRTLLSAWLDKHGLRPTWFGVDEITHHVVPEAPEEEIARCTCPDCTQRLMLKHPELKEKP